MSGDNRDLDDNEPRKSVIIFGRDITQIPCFRSSFLYGISGGLIFGTLTFLCTSRTGLATNIGFTSFFCGTIIYWCNCRYSWSKKRFEYSQLKLAMKKRGIYEGTEMEEKIKAQAEDV